MDPGSARMTLDRDYPWTRREVIFTLVGLAVLAAIGVALFGGYLPGVHPPPSSAGRTTVDGHPYDVTTSQLHFPVLVNQSLPWNVTFRNVSFDLWVTNWYSPLGGVVHGVGTEPNGTSYGFSLGGYAADGARITLFLAPDYAFGVAWAGGALGGLEIDLLVEA